MLSAQAARRGRQVARIRTLQADNANPTQAPTVVKPAGTSLVQLLVLAYAACVFLPFLGSARTLTPHEVMAVHPAQRMLAEGHWIVPRYGGGFWLDKPPLTSWLTAGSLALFGSFSEFAARLPVALCAIALCGLMCGIASRFFGAQAGLLAGLVQATSVYMFMQGRLAEPDMVLALMLAAAHCVLLWNWGRGDLRLSWRAGALFHFFAGLAVLAKGPAAVAFLAATIFAFAIFSRSTRPIRSVLLNPGILVFLLIAAGWHIAAYLSVGQEALEQWTYNNLRRFVGQHRLGGSDSLFSYFYNLPWLMLPWSIVLVLGAPRLKAALREEHAAVHRFLWSWFLGGFVFLMLSLFKHKHYLLPILPPLSILTSVLLAERFASIPLPKRRVLYALFAAALPLFWFIGGYAMPLRDHRRGTAEFVRAATAKVPADETLHVLVLYQAPVSPYIQHAQTAYLDTPEAVEAALQERGDEPMWILTIRRNLSLAERYGYSFESLAEEPPRRKDPPDKSIVIGRLSRAPASRPS